ncbi:helix-turn-helix transcriptional regulator [Streptomyces syringium]
MTGRPWGAPGAESGVPHRAVVERAALAGERGREGATAVLGGVESARLRAVERVPAELVIADRRIALLPLASHTAESAALVVHGGALLESLVNLFEDVWHEALPIRPAGADPGRACPLPGARISGPGAPGPDAVDLEVLALLLVGLTDASVAKQLGLGLRTVQRRVKRLMELAGVTTRLQLGWHAAEHGWTARA